MSDIDPELIDVNSDAAERRRREAAEEAERRVRARTWARGSFQGVNPAGTATPEKRSLIPSKKSTTPRDVAVMSNAVHSIGHRQEKKFLIRRRVPEFEFSAPGLNAMRLMLALLFNVRAKTDHEFEEITFSVPDLGRTICLDYRLVRTQAERLLQDLSSVYFTMDDKGCFVAAPLMAISRLDADGVVHLKINDELEPYLLDLQKNYRQLHRSVLLLQSVRSVLLYILARKYIGYRWLRRHRVPLAEILKVMRVGEDITWAEFHKDHLKPAIEEINAKTELKVEYAPLRDGRVDRQRGQVEAVVFKVTEHKSLGRAQGRGDRGGA